MSEPTQVPPPPQKKHKDLGFLTTAAVDNALSALGSSNALLTELAHWKDEALKRARAGTVWSLDAFITLGSRAADILGRHGLRFDPDFTMYDVGRHKDAVKDLPDDQVLGVVPLFGFFFFDKENTRSWSYHAMVIYQTHLLCQYVGV